MNRTFILAIAAVFLAGCGHPKELRVPLDYRPTDRPGVGSFQLPPPDLRLAVTVADSRSEKSEIGRYVEDSPAVPVYSGDPQPDVFVRDVVVRELAAAGIKIETESHHATKVLNLRLNRFWTEEGHTYETTIVTDAELTNAAGHRLWASQVAGHNERFGRTLSAENYQEGLSDASLDLVHNLLTAPGFDEALKTPPSDTQRAPRSRRH